MPHLKWTPRALSDIARLHAFLNTSNPQAAKRAIKTIRTQLKQLSCLPRMGRKIDEKTFSSSSSEAMQQDKFSSNEAIEPSSFDPREFVIEFGASGYIVFYWQDEDCIFILAIRHQREAGY